MSAVTIILTEGHYQIFSTGAQGRVWAPRYHGELCPGPHWLKRVGGVKKEGHDCLATPVKRDVRNVSL